MKFNLRFLLLGVVLAACLFSLPGILHTLYYAEYNAVVSRLEEIPGLTIVSSWQHEDVTLEDCGFTLQMEDAVASFVFWDRQDWRGLFNSIDGIRFQHAGGTRFVSCRELQDAGIPVGDLAELLIQLPEVLRYCTDRGAADPAADEDAEQVEDQRKWVTMRPPREL